LELTNFVAIVHANEEYSRYDHLAPQSAKVKVGQAVSEELAIAKVGMTGYTFRPHLHFQVFIFTRANIWIDFDTVSVQDFISWNYCYIIECASFSFHFPAAPSRGWRNREGKGSLIDSIFVLLKSTTY
jgi:murein DD-endopeptidase MepM/ murein hydrolase activator NlpD